jgi:hypothetical protein
MLNKKRGQRRGFVSSRTPSRKEFGGHRNEMGESDGFNPVPMRKQMR